MSDQPTDPVPTNDPPPVDQPTQDQPPVQQPDPTASAAAPPATSTDLPAICLPLKGTTACPEFASLQAYIPANVNVRDVAGFDSLIKSSLITSNSPAVFGGMARGFCPAWDGTGIRYYQSSLCGYFIGMGVTNGVTAGSTCNPAGSVNMCASTLIKFAASWKSAFGTKAGCAAGNGVTPLGDVYSGPSGALSSASTCVVSVAAESSNCGFATAAESKAFCATTPTETCCNAGGAASAPAAVKATIVPTTAAIATTTSAVAPAATTAASTGLSQSTIMYIAAGGGGGLFLIVLIIVLLCCCKRKTKQSEDSDYAAQQFSNNVPMKSMQSPQAPYANDRSALTQNGAPIGVGQPPMMGGGQKDMYEAVYDYNPQQPDELDTRVGDKIIIKTEFDDGWAFGFNTRTRREGHFPLDILDKWAQQHEGGQNGGVSMYSKRQSSMYGGKPAAGTDSMYYGGNGTDSVYYGDANTQSVYGTESMYVDNRAGGKIHKAAYDFTPAMPDEMELRVGDTIELKHEYDDGWGFGRNEVTGQEGLFPLDCLPGFGEDQGYDEQGKKKHNNRASSIYGGQQSMYGTDSMYQPGGANSMYGTDSVYQGNNTDSMYYGNNTDSVYYGNNTDSMYDAPAPQKGRR
ncbi:hypothetical protein HDU81_002282 [Chytriomyces hyalinus]|nr:hypothetical protein HDU81_002282 [Chytriomyces hyalinus]